MDSMTPIVRRAFKTVKVYTKCEGRFDLITGACDTCSAVNYPARGQLHATN